MEEIQPQLSNPHEYSFRPRTISENVRVTKHQAKLDLDNVPVPKDLGDLCEHLRSVFADDVVNVDYVTKLLENYKSNAKDWRKYAKYDPHK